MDKCRLVAASVAHRRRAGVSLLDVEKAALQLQGRAKNPSVDAVREILGTGSKATIAKHLRDWKAQQSQSSGKLPQEFGVGNRTVGTIKFASK